MKTSLIALALLLALACTQVSAAERVDSQIVSKGEYGQVSTIAGNGMAGQGALTLDHPRFPAPLSNGSVLFLDGDQRTMKLRKWNGKKNSTLVEMKKNKVTSKEGDFYSTGLVTSGKRIFFSSEEKVYELLSDNRVTELQGLTRYMKDHQYEYIYRMKVLHGDLIFMLWSKLYGGSYGFVKYSLVSKDFEELLSPSSYPNASDFSIQDLGISVSSLGGMIYYEKFFPRASYEQMDTNQGAILDTWVAADKSIYYAICRDQVKYEIYRLSESGNNLGEIVAGGKMGYVDGVADEASMQYPTDFVWDGSGYIFADRDNDALRKIWIDEKPLALVQ